MSTRFFPADKPLCGSVRVPGDKSISHRAVLFAAMAQGTSRLSGVLDSEDVRSTIAAVTALGATLVFGGAGPHGLDVTVTGWGQAGPRPPAGVIQCGNSGTTCRLLLGVLAGWPVPATLDGDESLRRRPMRRIAEPLEAMGARVETTDGRLPVRISGGGLHGERYDSPVASAQVKTAILLGGVRATGVTAVAEPAQSRDHSELLLPAFGVPVTCTADRLTCEVAGPVTPTAADIAVPADPSSAAFLAGAAAIVDGSEVVLQEVALNPTRLGFVGVLRAMGADVEVVETGAVGGERVGTITVRHQPDLIGVTVPAADVPSLIDEVPLLAVVAAFCDGTTRFEGVGELRVKESDRLAAVADGLTRLGAVVRTGDDWLEVDGPAHLHGAALDSLGDHRLAMAWAVAALGATGPVVIEGFEAVSVSYPGFAADLIALGDSTVA